MITIQQTLRNSKTKRMSKAKRCCSTLTKQKRRHCNLCGKQFQPAYRYQLFCKHCRNLNESYLFNEWLPHTATA